MTFMGTTQVQVLHTLTIESKEGRYRCTLNDFIYSTDSSEWALEKMKYKSILRKTAEQSEELLDELAAAMTRDSPVGDDDW